MPTVIPFIKNGSGPNTPDTSPMTEMIRDELNQLSNNTFMVESILERMKPFIATLDYDLGVDLEVTDENEAALMQVIPAVQELQAKFDDIISEVISERILHEIHLFHLQRLSKS